MLGINNLSVHFGGRTLFEGITFQVTPTDRIGLAGRNGAGKSTLLKIIAGKQKPDDGHINIPKEYTIGYLQQEIDIAGSGTVFEEASKAFERILKLEKRLHELEHEIGNVVDYESDHYARLADELTSVSHQYELLGGSSMDKEIEQVLTGLGFQREQLYQPLKIFSGGWQMRVELAKILLAKPDILLLDEPTNHLDIESIIWLEQFLKEYPGGIVLVSHDKALLNNMTNRTIEIENGKIYDYRANYDRYLEQRAERKEKAVTEKKQQDKYVEHTEQLINKFRAKKNKAAFAQSLIKKLDKLDRVEVEEEDTSKIKISFPEPPRSGKVAVEAKHIQKNYGDNEVLKDISLIIERGEKIAFVGKNGEGKTTLSKIVAGKVDHTGDLKMGHNVITGFFEQHQAEMMDGDLTVFETIDQLATGEMRTRVRSLLGAFLFSGDDVDKKVKVLSGGEKGRLALCKMLLQPANLLIMDEPTNHLDMRSKEILKHALLQFSGTLIVVSHDRDFLQGLSEKIYEFKGGFIKEYLGDIQYFLEKRQVSSLQELEKKEKPKVKPVTEVSKNGRDHKELFETKKQLDRDERKLRNDVSKAEKAIAETESAIKEVELEINDPTFYEKAQGPGETFKKYDTLKQRLNEQMGKWEGLLLQLEELEEQKKVLE